MIDPTAPFAGGAAPTIWAVLASAGAETVSADEGPGAGPASPRRRWGCRAVRGRFQARPRACMGSPPTKKTREVLAGKALGGQWPTKESIQ